MSVVVVFHSFIHSLICCGFVFVFVCTCVWSGFRCVVVYFDGLGPFLLCFLAFVFFLCGFVFCLARRYGWDIGAREVTRQMSERVEAGNNYCFCTATKKGRGTQEETIQQTNGNAIRHPAFLACTHKCLPNGHNQPFPTNRVNQVPFFCIANCNTVLQIVHSLIRECHCQLSFGTKFARLVRSSRSFAAHTTPKKKKKKRSKKKEKQKNAPAKNSERFCLYFFRGCGRACVEPDFFPLLHISRAVSTLFLFAPRSTHELAHCR